MRSSLLFNFDLKHRLYYEVVIANSARMKSLARNRRLLIKCIKVCDKYQLTENISISIEMVFSISQRR